MLPSINFPITHTALETPTHSIPFVLIRLRKKPCIGLFRTSKEKSPHKQSKAVYERFDSELLEKKEKFLFRQKGEHVKQKEC